jgi:hypothetical protein
VRKYVVRSLTTYIYSIITRFFMSKRIEWMRNAVHMKDMKNARKTLETLRHLERPKHTWKDAISVYVQNSVWERVEWIELAEDMDQIRDFVKKENQRAFRSYN